MTNKNNEKIKNYIFSEIYDALLYKLEKKGRTKEELNKLIFWLTSYNLEQLEQQLSKKIIYKDFLNNCPKINENINQIKGKICGYKVEQIEDPVIHQIRVLDKLVDELAKGKKLDKILP